MRLSIQFHWPGLENVRKLFGRKAKVLHFSKLANLLAQRSHFILSRTSFTSSGAEVHLWSFSRSQLRQTWNSVARTWSSCKERRWPQPCKLFDSWTLKLSKKTSLIGDCWAQGQLFSSFCPTLSIASLPVHLVNCFNTAQSHILQPYWSKKLSDDKTKKCRPAPQAACSSSPPPRRCAAATRGGGWWRRGSQCARRSSHPT